MNARTTLNVIGAAFILAVLICVGIFFWAKWEKQRFDASLPEVPKVSPVTVSQNAQSTSVAKEEPQPPQEPVLAPAPLEAGPVTYEPEQVTSENASEPLAVNEFMEFLDAPLREEDVPALFEGEWVNEEDAESQAGSACTDAGHRTDPDALRNRYGDSPDIEVVIEVNRLIDAGIATTDDVIAQEEAWLRLLPEDDYRNREETAKFLEHLYQTKKNIESGVTIKVVYSRIRHF